MDKPKRTNPLTALLRERSTAAARLVRANAIHDDLRPHRIGVCQRELEALNTRISALRKKSS